MNVEDKLMQAYRSGLLVPTQEERECARILLQSREVLAIPQTPPLRRLALGVLRGAWRDFGFWMFCDGDCWRWLWIAVRP